MAPRGSAPWGHPSLLGHTTLGAPLAWRDEQNPLPFGKMLAMANGALLLAANPAMQLWRPTATKQTTIEPQSLEVARGAATGEETKKECNCGGREGYEGGSSAC